MTTQERLESLENELARAKLRNCRLLICAVVCLVMIFVWGFLAQPGLLGTAQASDLANPYEAEITKLQADVNLLKRENDRLRWENERLKHKLEDHPQADGGDEDKNERAEVEVLLRKDWGGKFDENLRLANRVFAENVADKDKDELLAIVGNNAAIIKLFARLGEAYLKDKSAAAPTEATPPVKAAPPPPPQSYTCPKCDGRGSLRVRSGGTFGITTARPCPFCSGTGKVTSMPPRRGDETVEEHEAAQRALKGLPPRAVEPAAPAAPSRVEPTAPDTSKSERCPFCGRAGGPTGEIRTVYGYPIRVFMCGQGHEWLKR